MTTHRPERVADLLRAALAQALREEVRDPRIGFVTLTGVRLSPDLRLARVFVSSLETDARRQEVLAGLRRASSFLRRAVARDVRLKYVPRLEFVFDEAVERGSRVERLLDDLRRERAGAPDDAPREGSAEGEDPS